MDKIFVKFHLVHDEPGEISHFTTQVLSFWAENCKKLPAFAKAARIVFALNPNSAACERVFSLLKLYFGDQQTLALADQIELALMLAYNARKVG